MGTLIFPLLPTAVADLGGVHRVHVHPPPSGPIPNRSALQELSNKVQFVKIGPGIPKLYQAWKCHQKSPIEPYFSEIFLGEVLKTPTSERGKPLPIPFPSINRTVHPPSQPQWIRHCDQLNRACIWYIKHLNCIEGVVQSFQTSRRLSRSDRCNTMQHTGLGGGHSLSVSTQQSDPLRGRPLIIWGCGANFREQIFFR